MKEDYIAKDKEGNDINLDEYIMIYIKGLKLIKDVFVDNFETSNKVLTTFFHELRSTMVGLIGGIEKKDRNVGISMLFGGIDIMKRQILLDVETIESREKK